MKPYQLHPAQILRHNALYLAIISALYPSFSTANPSGAQVISGQVSIDQSVSGVTTIKNSPNAIINWQNFNIAKNEITQFIQQNGQSAVLNRIVGGNPSEILGSLYSNGKVFLINPNGIVFGAGSKIDTQGLLASSLNLSDNDFQKGNFHFIAGSKAGDIANEGIIHAGKDGNIVLVAPNIQNNGIIKSEGGKIVLAAGQELILTSMDDPEIRFQVQAPKNHVLNVGQLLTEGGSINVFAGSIKHSGDISADSVEIDKQGNIRLVAKGDVTLEKDSTISANNEKGVAGKIEVTGENVAVLDNSKIEAIGEKGGGEILVGGDYQGKNVAVQNAKITTIAENVEIKADAKNQGKGGKVIVWADDETKVAAKISAKGGAKSGDGGFVETSAHKLNVSGIKVDASAPKGKSGEWLLDPWNVTIVAGDTADTTLIANPYHPSSTSTISAQQIANALVANDVSISTNSRNPSIPGGDAGDIIVGAAITWASNKLTFIAEHDITINNALNGGTTGKLELNAGHLITATSAVNVGEFTLSSGAWIQNGTLPSFSATDFMISGGTFLRVLGGDGNTAPYQITDVYGLQGAKGFLSNSFVLANNIDATGTSGWNWDGDVYYNGFEPIGNSDYHFTGTFNGQNHTISNLNINRPSEYGGIGLFSHSSGIIQNLGLTHVSISGGSIVGSIVGFNLGSVSRSYSTGAVSGTNYIGGLIGKNYSGTVSDTYSMVSVTGNEKVGGLVGAIDGTNPIIENSYSTGLVSLKENSGSTYIGGLVGYSLGYNGGQVGTIANSYWDKDTTRQPISAADVNNNSGMDLTTAQMQQSANFIGFNFANTWTITNGSSYPHLAWQGLDVRVTPPSPPAFTPMQIKITADGFSRSYGSVNPDFTGTLTEGSYLGSDTWDSLGVLFSTNANQKSEIGNYSIVPTITNGRYALTPINGTLTITPASLMITANALSKSYNTMDPALTYGTVGLLDGDTLVGGLSRTSGENVGRYPITSTLANPNYDISYSPADFVITPANLTITANPQTKIYGTNDPSLTYVSQGLLGNDTLSGNLTRTPGENVGRYTITQGDLHNPNYTLNYIGAELGISPANLTITANPQTKIYGTNDPSLTYVSQGLLGNDTLSGNLTRTTGKNVGRYTIMQGDLHNPNYTLSYIGAELGISPANLTITAHPQTKIYGTSDPSLTYVSQGLLNNDTLSGNLTRTTGENVGRYTITQGDLHNPNYTLSYIGAELGISPANLTITAHPQAKIYGTSDPSLTYVSQGLLNNDTLSGNLTRTTGENVGRYTITQGDLHNPNYTLSYIGAELGISPANLTITAHPQSKTFGEVDPKLTFSIQGLVGEDKLTGELSRVAGETVKTYEITSNVSAGDNYTLSYIPNFLTINRAPKITWISQTDNQWQNAANWNQGVLPDSTQDVSIPNTNFNIDMAGTINVNSLFSLASLHLVDGASVNVTNPFTLQIETILSGKGTFITPEFINNGTISAGDSPGIIAITGDFIQTESGLLKMEIQDETPSGYDQLNISGDATLNGTIKLISLNGYKPSPNFQPKFLSARRFSGGFSRIDNSEGSGLNYQFNFVDGQLAISLLPSSLEYQATIRNLADDAKQAELIISEVEKGTESQMNTVITMSPQQTTLVVEELKKNNLVSVVEKNSTTFANKSTKTLGVCQ